MCSPLKACFKISLLTLYLKQDYIDIKVVWIIQKIPISYHFSFSYQILLTDNICVVHFFTISEKIYF